MRSYAVSLAKLCQEYEALSAVRKVWSSTFRVAMSPTRFESPIDDGLNATLEMPQELADQAQAAALDSLDARHRELAVQIIKHCITILHANTKLTAEAAKEMKCKVDIVPT